MPTWTAEDRRQYADLQHDDRDPDKVTPVVVIYASDPEPIRQTLRQTAMRNGWRIQEVNE